MNAPKKNIVLALVAFAFLCVTLTSCDHHTCPTYSKATTEKPVENKG